MMTQPFVLLWTLLFAIHTFIAPLELTLARMPNGRTLAASLHNVSENVNAVRAHLEQANGTWTDESVDQGEIFSVSTPVILAGFAYLAAVCNLAVCIYRRNLSNPSAAWEGKQLSGINDVASVTLAITAAGVLGLTLQTLSNQWWYFTAPHTLALAALTFISVQGFSEIISPFGGGERAAQAQGPGDESCHLVRLALFTYLAALCYIGGVWQTIALESMAAPSAGDLDIETAAYYFAGYYYFMYVLASGSVRLARLAAATQIVSVITLGLLTLPPNIVPGVALQRVGEQLVAAWPGAAVAVSLLVFTAVALTGFPLSISGPIALLGLSAWSILACGAGSIACSVGSVPASAVPMAGAGAFAVLAAMLLFTGLFVLSRRPALSAWRSRRRRGGFLDP